MDFNMLGMLLLLHLCGVHLAESFDPDHPLLPQWQPTYDFRQSTLFQSCNQSGYLDPKYSAQFGIADYDWSNAKDEWCNAKPMDCEERMVTQAIMTKNAACPNECPLPDGCRSKSDCTHTRVWVYRNIVKALPWFTSVREKLEDPAYSGWFLHFRDGINGSYHVPPCTGDKCSAYYHDQLQTPRYPHGRKPTDGSCKEPCDCGSVPCGEYLFDHRNASLGEWLVKEFILGPNGLGNPNIDGFYLDDEWWSNGETGHHLGPTEEDVHCEQDMGLNKTEVLNITAGWQDNWEAIQLATVNNGGFISHMMTNGTRLGPPWASTPFNKQTCTDYMRMACQANTTVQKQPLWYKFTSPSNLDEDIASFLIIRGPYAWIGYGWKGCSDSVNHWPWNDRFNLDYGTPNGLCSEIAPNVFSRDYTKANATMDCHHWKGAVVMKS